MAYRERSLDGKARELNEVAFLELIGRLLAQQG